MAVRGRGGNNNIFDVMRSMLGVLDGHLEHAGLGTGVHVYPSGAFVARLRNRLRNLIGNVVGYSGSNDGIREDDFSARGFRGRRDAQGRGRRRVNGEVTSSGERGGTFEGVGEGQASRRRCVPEADNAAENRRDENVQGGSDSVGDSSQFVVTSFIVADISRPRTVSEREERSSSSGASRETRSQNISGRGSFRIVLPHTSSQELRLLLFTPQTDRVSPESFVYEIQVNFDLLDPSAEVPVTATKESLWKSKILKATVADESCECSICMINFSKDQKLRMLPCDHRFHMKCIDKWLLRHSNKCPMCRTTI